MQPGHVYTSGNPPVRQQKMKNNLWNINNRLKFLMTQYCRLEIFTDLPIKAFSGIIFEIFRASLIY